MEQLDQGLWELKRKDFVPRQLWTHNNALDSGTRDVLLGWDEPPTDRHELLINLQDNTPLCFSRFERLIEIIDSNAPESGRARYKFYRERGYPLQTHKIAS